MSEDCPIYDGPDRRSYCEDKIYRIVGDKVGQCKEQVYVEIHGLRGDISKMNDRMNIISDDVHKLGMAVRDVANNSRDIADTLRDMREMANTYRQVRGFWSVVTWIRNNAVTIAIASGVVYMATTGINFSDLLK